SKLLNQMVTVTATGNLQAWNLSSHRTSDRGLKSVANGPLGVSFISPTAPSKMQLSADWLNRVSSGSVLSSVALSADGQTLAVAKTDGWIEILQLQSDQPPRLLHRIQSLPKAKAIATPKSVEATPVVVRQMSFSPDGQKLLGLGDDLTVRLWNVSSGKLLQKLQGHQATIEQARFSPNSQQIVTASWDRTARIWDVASGRLVRLLPHTDVVSSAFFSPDNQQVVTASWDGAARVFDATTGALRVVLAGHHGPVLDAEFSPNGRSLVTASADGTARLWDARTGTEQAQLRPFSLGDDSSRVRRAFFSPDGQYVATLSDDGKVRLWAATWDVLLKLARDRTLRQLMPEECIRYLRLAPSDCPALSTSTPQTPVAQTPVAQTQAVSQDPSVEAIATQQTAN
ncbi:MAG TPA: WD40 repeat domain-containing protein, partial [Candidatus Obscuribacterales bacterium]